MRTTIKLTATPGTAYKRVCHAFGGFFECGANNVFWDWGWLGLVKYGYVAAICRWVPVRARQGRPLRWSVQDIVRFSNPSASFGGRLARGRYGIGHYGQMRGGFFECGAYNVFWDWGWLGLVKYGYVAAICRWVPVRARQGRPLRWSVRSIERFRPPPLRLADVWRGADIESATTGECAVGFSNAGHVMCFGIGVLQLAGNFIYGFIASTR
jgi:hypothetical protein